ncbi:MAG: Slp family lipoprotein [Deltaproteobacteria bacterium]|nr:Slp family lipoprotein [Deltaproteobacteria bacterium]
MRQRFPFVSFLLALGVCACVLRAPLDTRGVDPGLTPDRAAAAAKEASGRTVQWGGLLIRTTNLEEVTELEVLAYPLDRQGRPRTGEAPQGRFLALRDGYVEAAVYAPGRLVTVVGRFSGTRAGLIGAMEYLYPLVKVEQLYLWPADESGAGPRFHLGVGVGL